MSDVVLARMVFMQDPENAGTSEDNEEAADLRQGRVMRKGFLETVAVIFAHVWNASESEGGQLRAADYVSAMLMPARGYPCPDIPVKNC